MNFFDRRFATIAREVFARDPTRRVLRCIQIQAAACGLRRKTQMDTTTLLIIVLLILLLGGGGWYGRGRWY